MRDQENGKEIVIYQERCQNFRSLNDLMWKIPFIAMTLTGGLWFGVASLDFSNEMRKALLFLSAVSNCLFVIVLYRVRSILAKYLEWMREFESEKKSKKLGYCVVTCFSIILIVASLLSAVICYNIEKFFS